MNRYDPYIQVIGNEDQRRTEMYKIISKNRANDTTKEISLRFANKDRADRFAVRCTFSESNPDVIYTVVEA